MGIESLFRRRVMLASRFRHSFPCPGVDGLVLPVAATLTRKAKTFQSVPRVEDKKNHDVRDTTHAAPLAPVSTGNRQLVYIGLTRPEY